MANGDRPREGSQILVLDPDERRRETLRAVLAPGCPMVRVAANLEEALIEARRLPPDYPSVALLDFAATNGEAEEMASALRGAAPADLLVILLSSLTVPRIPGIDAAIWRTADPRPLHAAISSELTGLASRKIVELVVVLLGVQPLHPGRPVVTGGTGCLVQIVLVKFLLTAAHVARELFQTDLNWIMGGNANVTVRVPSQPMVLGIDDRLDIAAVALPDDFDASLIGRRFYTPERWPPVRAVVDEVALFVGFPGEIRGMTGDTINARGMVLTSRVAGASVERFILTADEDAQIKSKAQLLRSFGGISGAPVFVSRERGLTLVGVINHSTTFNEGVLAADGMPARKGGAFYAAHGDVISATGVLAHPADADV